MSNFGNVIQKEKSTDNNDSVILSIVIPSYNSAKLLSRCISALENQSAKKAYFEITVANDGSTDETVEMLEN
ncbi:MAG: glycosyltransferase, partial [SAR324 cluster bacterium]|nr:glycosyltransferase [SAR324 cluster bacterium]